MQTRIDRALVHKEADSEVLLTSADKTTDGRWLFGIALPRNHSTARHSTSGIATLLGTELMRQTALAFVHLDGQVPQGWAFLLHELNFSWLRDPGTVPGSDTLDGWLDVRIRDIGMRKNQLSDLQLEATLTTVDGDLLGTGYGDLSCLPPTAYKAIRRNAPAVERVNTGGLDSALADVTCEGSDLAARLVWNWQDPFIFDHFSDHLPGILLAQGILEAHQRLTGEEAVQMHLHCGTFGEFNESVQVRAHLTGKNSTRTVITQNGRNLATGVCSSNREELREPAIPQFQRRIAWAR